MIEGEILMRLKEERAGVVRHARCCRCRWMSELEMMLRDEEENASCFERQEGGR